MKKRAAYTAPRLTRHGSIEKLTKGAAVGTRLDATFVYGTPITSITFS